MRIGTSRWRLLRTLTAALTVGALAFAGSARAADFEYSGDKGPGFWADQDPAWKACAGTADGFQKQSPVDISLVRINRRLRKLDLTLLETPINLLNDGHVIENEYEPDSKLAFDGVTYTLAQFHFHTLSEHTVGGKRGVMELHAVFKDDLVHTTKVAVVGMIYNIGRENPFLQELIDAGLPEKSTSPHVHGNPINLADALTNTLETEAGNVYCAGASRFGDDDPGFVPPDKDSGKCEDAVNKAVSTFAGCVGKCEVKQADVEFKGKTFDKNACENLGKSACRTKYDAASVKLEPKPGKHATCPACLDMTARGNLADAAENFLEQQQGQIYCVGTVPLQ